MMPFIKSLRLFSIYILLTFNTQALLFSQFTSDKAIEITGAGIKEIPLWEPPSNAVFIDPKNVDDPKKDGSIKHPFSSFEEIKWKDNTVYALKRNTEIIVSEAIMLSANQITLASYGSGSRPRIFSTTEKHALTSKWENANKIIIRDIEIHAPKAESGIIIRTGSKDASIINCVVHGPRWGIRVLNDIDKVFIHNTEIFHIKEDGIFMKQTSNIEISNCYIHHVNQFWQAPSTAESDAPGDGIQLYLCNQWHIHHNFIDRSDSGNKFCIISNNPEQENGLIEYNYLIGPIKEGFAIYLGDGKNHTIRYNIIYGNCKSPFWSHASDLQIYYNIFAYFEGPLFVSKNADIFNNLFYQTTAAIEGGRINAFNNIFELQNVKCTVFKVSELNESNNLYTRGLPSKASFMGDAKFIAPEKGDFRPGASSSCIKKGKVTFVLKDLLGNTIPSGMLPDIGPIQYTPE